MCRFLNRLDAISSFIQSFSMNRDEVEVKKMKIKSALAFIIFASMLVAIAPTIAAPTNGQKVEVTQISDQTPAASQPADCIRDGIHYPYTGTSNLNPGEVSHRQDYGTVFGTTLIIHYKTGDVTITGKSFNNYDRMFRYVNPYPNQLGAMLVAHYDAIWEFQAQTGLTQYGGFEGNINMLITDYTPGTPATYQATFNCVLKGFGSFEGQTIQFSYSGASGQPWEGYLLKP